MKPGVDFPLTVVALGMLADITAPLLLVPECDLIVVVDLVDELFLRSFYLPCNKPKKFPEIREFIKHILTNGSDLKLICNDCMVRFLLVSAH